jgi:hypothetical protein
MPTGRLGRRLADDITLGGGEVFEGYEPVHGLLWNTKVFPGKHIECIVERGRRLAVRDAERRLGQHVVLSLPRDSYVVTRSRPYPARQSRKVEAVSGWRLAVRDAERKGKVRPQPFTKVFGELRPRLTRFECPS